MTSGSEAAETEPDGPARRPPAHESRPAEGTAPAEAGR